MDVKLKWFGLNRAIFVFLFFLGQVLYDFSIDRINCLRIFLCNEWFLTNRCSVFFFKFCLEMEKFLD